jgi:S1-C subfamily serine protease
MRKSITLGVVALALFGFAVIRRGAKDDRSDAKVRESPGVETEISASRNEAGPSVDAAQTGLDNPYLKTVDKEIKDPELRAAIRRVQPACVRIANASGINLAPYGLVLTAAHVASPPNELQLMATFPDGRSFAGKWTAIDGRHDLALCRLEEARDLPFAMLGDEAPEVGAVVVCIGQPATLTPKGEPTDYEPFDVSVGEIRGIIGEATGNQRPLGRAMHDAWTYWGHSGAPLFNQQGRIVAMHNSWDPRDAMRHAVTYEAIRQFLEMQGIVEPEEASNEH